MTTLPEQSVGQERFSEERAELESVIASALRPTSNMARLLRFVCEKQFCGLADEIKEYNIAVEALQRPSTFDPSRDSIVRVEAHRLRNRLERFYMQDGASHTIRIVIPTGSYVPKFEYSELPPKAFFAPLSGEEIQEQPESAEPVALPSPVVAPVKAGGFPRRWWFAGVALLLALVAALFYGGSRHSQANATAAAASSQIPRRAGGQQVEAVRIVAGISSPAFTDALGTSWTGDRYFVGGSAESVSPRAISFAQDPSLFLHRRRGDFSYAIPLRSGVYELRLYFADVFFGENNPDGGGEGSRVFDVQANGRVLLHNLDVISDAGGSNTGDVKVFGGIQPDASGYLRLNFIAKRNVPFINAIEILPTSEGQTVPQRIVMQKAGYTDPDGKWWEPDHFYRGGVSIENTAKTGVRDEELPESKGERYGNFVYTIPVAAGRRYRATFTFKEIDQAHLLRETAGETVDLFSVFANSKPLIDNLQIGTVAGKDRTVRRTFSTLTPNAQDKLIFSFVPSHNYAVVNSIEVVEDKEHLP